jgi:DNA-binding transcriptional regulator YhcF (GntR family)
MLAQTNHPGYVKDIDSGTIINNNEEEYKKFLASREASKRNNNVVKRLDEVEVELREIKNLLLQIVNRNGTN